MSPRIEATPRAGIAATLVTLDRDERGRAHDRELQETDEADPDDLAREQAAWLDRGEQDLHDPRRLLLDHALGHHVPVLAERDPEQDAEGQAGEQVLGVLGIGGLQQLDRDQGHGRGDGRR